VIGTDPKTKITEPVSWKTDVLAGRFWAPVAIYIYIYIHMYKVCLDVNISVNIFIYIYIYI